MFSFMFIQTGYKKFLTTHTYLAIPLFKVSVGVCACVCGVLLKIACRVGYVKYVIFDVKNDVFDATSKTSVFDVKN